MDFIVSLSHISLTYFQLNIHVGKDKYKKGNVSVNGRNSSFILRTDALYLLGLVFFP